MKIIDDYSKYSILIIEDTCNEQEADEVFNELKRIVRSVDLLPPEMTGVATHEDGSFAKNNSSIFLNNIYTEYGKSMSPIHSILEKKIISKEIFEEYAKMNPFNSLIFNVRIHSTLINYYSNKEEYDFHPDSCMFTATSFFFKTPKLFSGGDVVFLIDGEKIVVNIKNNMSIIFPSSYFHKVETVMLDEKDNLSDPSGRFSIVQFMKPV